MSLLWIEGFEGYAPVNTVVDNNTFKIRWARSDWSEGSAATGTSIQAGHIGGKCLRVYGTSEGNFCTTPNIANDDEIYFGLRFRIDSAPISGNETIVGIVNSAGTTIATLAINTSRQLLWGTTSGTGITGTTSALTLDTWYYIEGYVKFHASAGAVEIKLDGVSALAQTGIDTVISGGTTTWAALFIDAPLLSTGGKYWWFDDIYILDGNGSAPHNTYLGDCRVIGLFPDADSGPNDFATSSGTDHHALVSEVPASESSYIDGEAGDIDLFTHTNLSEGGTIFGVLHVVEARKTEPEAPDLRLKCVSGGTTDNGTTEQLAAGVYTQMRILESDPDTSTPWTQTTLNAAEFGVEAV